MRFLAKGPSIPDDLLIARDEGRVLFFCGAGVSRARARLPDFFQLANDVVTALGCALDSPARELLNFARETQDKKNIAGMVTADRIFGLPIDPDRYDAKREIPEQSWSAFSATRLDREGLKPHQGASLTGHYSIRPSALADRVAQLGVWLSRVREDLSAREFYGNHEPSLRP